MTAACFQDGVPSHLLWCIVLDGQLSKLQAASSHAQGYADDTTIMVYVDCAQSRKMEFPMRKLNVNPKNMPVVLDEETLQSSVFDHFRFKHT